MSKREARRACKLIGEKFGITEVNLTIHKKLGTTMLRWRAGWQMLMLTVMASSVTRNSR